MSDPSINAVRAKVDDLAVELERRDNKILELEETENELRDDLREAERERDMAEREIPKHVAALIKAYMAHTSALTQSEHLDALIKAYMAHTSALTQSEHLDAIERLSPALAAVVRALL